MAVSLIGRVRQGASSTVDVTVGVRRGEAGSVGGPVVVDDRAARRDDHTSECGMVPVLTEVDGEVE